MDYKNYINLNALCKELGIKSWHFLKLIKKKYLLENIHYKKIFELHIYHWYINKKELSFILKLIIKNTNRVKTINYLKNYLEEI